MHTPYGWSSAASRACRLSLALSKLLGGWPGEAMMVVAYFCCLTTVAVLIMCCSFRIFGLFGLFWELFGSFCELFGLCRGP